MKRPALTHAAVAALLASAPAPLAAQAPRASESEIARAVDSLAARVMSGGLTPALGVAVARDGRIIFTKAYGWADASARIPADERTLWYVASTSKSYTGFGISLLAQQGRLRFDAPIATLLPGVRWPEAVDPSRLTLAQFLSHTHHLNDNAVVQSAAFTGAIPEARWPELIRFAVPRADTNLVYSNFGYNVAAMVIDRLRPEGWRHFLDSAVYRPAGLTETYARVSGLDPRRIAKPHDFGPGDSFVSRPFEKTDATMNSAGGHLATLRDLARWAIVQMDSGRIDGRQVFPKEAVALSQRLIARHTVEQSKRWAVFAREGWGAGWDLGNYQGEPMVSRFGGYSTIRSHLSMLPGRRIGVVAQANGAGGNPASDIIAALVYDLDAGRPYARDTAAARLNGVLSQAGPFRARSAATDSVRRSRQRPLGRPLPDYAGTYQTEAFGTLAFVVRDGALRYRWGVLEGPVEVFDADKQELRIEVAGTGNVVTFRFEGPGPAGSVELIGATFVRR